MSRGSPELTDSRKEEILLGLIYRKLTAWVEELHKTESNKIMTAVEFSLCLDKFFPSMPNEHKKSFQISFFSLLYGLDSFSIISEKQLEAFKISKISYYPSTVEMTLNDWRAGDICKENKIDVFDFCMMKQLLIKQTDK